MLCGVVVLPSCEFADNDDKGMNSEGSTAGGTGDESASATSTSVGSDASTTTGEPVTTGDSTASGTTTLTTAPTTGDPSTGDPSTGDPATTDAPTTTGDPTPPCEGDPKPLDLVTSIAYLESQLPPDMTTGGGSGGTDGGGPEPTTMYIKLSSQLFTCEDPVEGVSCGPEWEFTIVIPPEFQTPGAVYDLAGIDVFAYVVETGADQGNGECSGGAGSGGGTFQILDIDQNQVTGRLCDVPTWFFSETTPDLEGTFVAERC